jgi:hypothetical protein
LYFFVLYAIINYESINLSNTQKTMSKRFRIHNYYTGELVHEAPYKRSIFCDEIRTGVIVKDHASPSRPHKVPRFVDVLWDDGELEEQVHSTDLELINESTPL